MMSSELSYEHVLFFGRTLAEYELMFGIDISQWKGSKVLDCPSGPSSFVAEARPLGVKAYGCDPVYRNEIDYMMELGSKDIDLFVSGQKFLPRFFDQQMASDSKSYCEMRRKALSLFGQNFADGNSNSYYFAASLPNIPHLDQSFDLVLSANLLFFYSDIASGGTLPKSIFDYDFHLNAVLELYRLCSKEVRIYPLKGPNANKHKYLARLIDDLTSSGIDFQLKPVKYRGVMGAEHTLCLVRH